MLPGSGKAQNNADCRSIELDTGSSRVTERPADFFRHRQNLTLGIPHVLKNGVAWRLVTDTPTGLALPRIVKMSDRAAMDKANRLLDAAHGCLLIRRAWLESHWFGVGQAGGAGMAASPVFQPDPALVEVTYASPRLVSYTEVRVYAVDFASYDIEPRGVVLDLERNRIYQASGCGGVMDDSFGWFRLGQMLEVCTSEAKAKFGKIWSSKIEPIEKAAALAPDNCERRMGTQDSSSGISMYLKDDGLAMYDYSRLAGVPKVCLDAKKSLVGPVVIPYRELEAFMKSGPWRDELLKSAVR
jgi:hypothetical protein